VAAARRNAMLGMANSRVAIPLQTGEARRALFSPAQRGYTSAAAASLATDGRLTD